jgi:L-asparaginase/Glu-tRNA(Gln) amidotransferase subunit D
MSADGPLNIYNAVALAADKTARGGACWSPSTTTSMRPTTSSRHYDRHRDLQLG